MPLVRSLAVGDVFGRLTVVAITPGSGGEHRTKPKAICVCSCGSPSRAIRVDALSSRKTQSCGCLQVESATKHGCWRHRLFGRWVNMIRRCGDPTNARYADYGGRGITVCERWQDPAAFIADMAPSFLEGMELERIDNNAGYSPENCRWATHTEQARNKRNLIYLTYLGRTQSAKEWAREMGINYGTLLERIKVLGWDTERALTAPPLSAKERCQRARDARQPRS